MRLSIEPSDPGFQPIPIARLATVTLDGVKQNDCTVADEEAGYVVRFKRRTLFAFSQVGRSKQVPKEKVAGVVVITWPAAFDKTRLRGYKPPEKELPDGLWMNNGSMTYTCPRCENDREWYGTVEDFEDPDSVKLCGGTQWCIP